MSDQNNSQGSGSNTPVASGVSGSTHSDRVREETQRIQEINQKAWETQQREQWLADAAARRNLGT